MPALGARIKIERRLNANRRASRGHHHGLAGSITRHYDATSAVVGSNLPYARIQQLGGKAGRGHKSEIPARPFLKLTEEDEEKIIKSFNTFLSQAVG